MLVSELTVWVPLVCVEDPEHGVCALDEASMFLDVEVFC